VPVLNAFSKPPIGVVSPSNISFFTGNPPQQMQIFSGVAVFEFTSDHSVIHVTYEIILGFVRSRSIQFTAKADLASISNTDSEFIFAVDTTNVTLNEATGEIRLVVNIGVQGNKSTLLRFSYHVQVLSDIVDTLISGTIRWQENIATPHEPIFNVVVGTFLTPPGGVPHMQPVASGTSEGNAIRAGGFWSVAYHVDNVPLGTFDVVPSPANNMSLSNFPPGVNASSMDFVTSPRSVTLTPAMPVALGIDFEMKIHEVPR
jgi:hypothetical protein